MAGARPSRGQSDKCLGIYKLFATMMFFLVLITTGSLLYGSNPSSYPVRITDAGLPSSYPLHAYVSRTFLALRSDPLKARVDLLVKQAGDHMALANAYAAYARRLKLENMKQVRIFTEQSRNYTDLLNRPEYKSLADPSNEAPIDEETLRQFEKELKERIKQTRQLISEAKESFDNQLKIQKLKDTIFAVNDQLAKAKKQGAFSSLIAAKSIPRAFTALL